MENENKEVVVKHLEEELDDLENTLNLKEQLEMAKEMLTDTIIMDEEDFYGQQ
ncbi:MAG: hypothetical protein IJF92_05585 [Bacilli bacterium]|nr:hypothetical protein [Bacilli bacterium]